VPITVHNSLTILTVLAKMTKLNKIDEDQIEKQI